jgi:anti-sigma28 factor (negative regulator of flagellin synthesis)
MKIGLGSQDNIGQAQNTSQTGRVGTTSGAAQGPSSQQFGLDRVDVSSVAQTAASVIGITGNQRNQQVANLTQQYQSGQYTVDPVKLSQAIVNQDTDPTHAH